MGSNTDYLNDLESFLDNPTGLISTSPNPVMSPMSNPINNGAGVRDRLRHHLGAEKRKLEDVSDVSVKTQRTDEHHHMMLDGLDHDPYKTEELKQEVEVKEEQPQSGFGQGGLLAQALMDKRPSSTNGHLNPQTGFFGVSSPRSVGSPAVPAAPSIPDVMALRQQIQDIKSNRNLTNEQKNAKLTELVGQHPSLHRRLMMASKINNEKMMRRNLGQEQLMQREQIPGTNMVQDFGPGYPSNNNENAFHTGPYMDNGMQNFGGPIPPGPRSRGGRAPIPPANMNGMYQGPIQNEMWEVGGKCMPNQIAPHIQPPPQYPYRQPGPRPSNMMNHMTPCYNSPQSEYMATGMYGQQQQMYSNQRGGAGVMGEPLYPNETCGPGPIGTRGFNPSMYGSSGMRMVNPSYPSDNFQNEYMVSNGGRNERHPDFMYHQQQQQQPQQQQHRPINPPHSMGFSPQQHMQHQRGIAPGFGMSISPRLPSNVGQISPVMSPPMHSPASVHMPMGTPTSQQGMFNNSIGAGAPNTNGNAFNMQTNPTSNGFHFNEEFLGPSIQNQGLLSNAGLPEDTGIDSLLGVEDSATPSVNQLANWKLDAADFRRDLLQRILNALKDNQSAGNLDSEASAMEEEAFSTCDTEDSYVHKLAQWLASKFSSSQENPASQTSTSFPDSTTLQDSLSCPKLSSSTDGPDADMLAKANPILAETLAAPSDDIVNIQGPILIKPFSLSMKMLLKI